MKNAVMPTSIGFLPPLRDRIELALGGLTFLGSPVMKLLSLKSVDDLGIAMKSASVDLAGIYLEVEGKLGKLSLSQQF